MVFNQDYPDVLGAIAGERRFVVHNIEYALGIYPQHAYLNQPVELILIVQNMVDGDVQVHVDVQASQRDAQGAPIHVEVARTEIVERLLSGEVGLMHVPIVVHPPASDTPVTVKVVLHPMGGRDADLVRSGASGPQPSMLAVSPFRIQALRDVPFLQPEDDTLPAHLLTFNVSGRVLPPTNMALAYRYETLWSVQEAGLESAFNRDHLQIAREIAQDKTPIVEALEHITSERYAAQGLPLHPAEARAIACALAYTVELAPTQERSFALEESRWFRKLMTILSARPDLARLPRGTLFAEHLYDELLQDTLPLGFRLMQPRVQTNLGNFGERGAYAERIVAWLSGRGRADLNYVYMPLAMAGLLIARKIRTDRHQNPWRLVTGLHEAAAGRARLAGGVRGIVFNMLDDLLNYVERELKHAGIPRP